MRTWFENEAILRRLRDWLSRSEQEIRDADAHSTDDGIDEVEQPPVGLLQLMEAFTALRQELKLQTKSARGLEETVQQALTGLERASQQLSTIRGREVEAVEKAVQPLVMSLVELDEALERSERACVAIEKQMLAEAARHLDQILEREFVALSTWQRWRAKPWHRTVCRICQDEFAELAQQLLVPLREGNELIRSRLQRLLTEQQISRIQCVGLLVDPSRMNVIELVEDAALPAETVHEELRPGYTWRGRVIRFAEVRAVSRSGKGSPASTTNREWETGNPSDIQENSARNHEPSRP